VSVFLDVPSMEVLEARLRGRGTEEETRIRARMEAAEHEMALRDRYQYIVMNDEIDLAADKLNQIINVERRNRVC
jgi:guanylate kinase